MLCGFLCCVGLFEVGVCVWVCVCGVFVCVLFVSSVHVCVVLVCVNV